MRLASSLMNEICRQITVPSARVVITGKFELIFGRFMHPWDSVSEHQTDMKCPVGSQ